MLQAINNCFNHFILSNAAATQTQTKTLEQREAEYAEARMRIFGAATCPEEQEIGTVPERYDGDVVINTCIPYSTSVGGDICC